MRRDSRRRGDWYLGFPSEGKGCHLRLEGVRVLDISKSAILDWVFGPTLKRPRAIPGEVSTTAKHFSHPATS
jgi:hypothetical protein